MSYHYLLLSGRIPTCFCKQYVIRTFLWRNKLAKIYKLQNLLESVPVHFPI